MAKHDETHPSGTQSAAEYVRMSTEHQRYSTENQKDSIREYAARHGLSVVRTYTDAGRSGLRIDGRPALQQLLRDVESPDPPFRVILVYDISRWGRFQDADESAYYEYICKRAGIRVIYCAEQFENDDSPVSTIVKGVKRAMAGEYSRELSAKVFAGQCRLIELGFRQGGPAGYGLRRLLVDENRAPKGFLRRGEHKSLQTDRVILVPGPDSEIAAVNRIFSWFVDEGLNEARIAQRLNAAQILNESGRTWNAPAIHRVLTNEKYIGNNVYNRVSFKLKKLRVVNGPEMWIRRNCAFEPIVAPDVFLAAQGILRTRRRSFSDEELIARLRDLYRERGTLSSFLIDESEGMACSSVYAQRFGGLTRAYQLVGFRPDRDYRHIEINRFLREMHPEVIAAAEREIERVGGRVVRDSATDILCVNQEFTVSMVIARCFALPSGGSRWKVRLESSLLPDITVAVRLDPDNRGILDYFLLPRIDIGRSISLADHNGAELDAYRFDSLRYLSQMAEWAHLQRVA